MFDEGTGPPLVVIPGVQGRWEWMKPALRELKKRHRTLSYTLCGNAGAGRRFDPALGFDNYIHQLDDILQRAGLAAAALCGVSFGGFIALRYAAVRPERVTSLILVSAPAPGWIPNARQRSYVAHPWLSTPVFLASAPLRLWPEIHAAYDTPAERLGFTIRHAARVAAAPIVPPIMAARVRMQQRVDFTPDCARVAAPTLVMTGEDHLDKIVPPEVTRRYRALIPGAEYARMPRTGHIGLLTQPGEFAGIVTRFMHANHH